MRRADVGEVSAVSPHSGYFGYPAAMKKDASLRYAIMGPHSPILTFQSCEAQRSSLVRPEATQGIAKRATAGDCPCYTRQSHIGARHSYSLSPFNPLRARDVTLWTKFGTRGEGVCPPVVWGREKKTLNLGAPSPLVTPPCNLPSGEDPREPPVSGPTAARPVPDCVMMEVSASQREENPSTPAYQKLPMLPVRSHGVPGPSPNAKWLKEQEADGISKPTEPIPAPPSTSRPAFLSPKPSENAQNHPPGIPNPRGGHRGGLAPEASGNTTKSQGRRA